MQMNKEHYLSLIDSLSDVPLFFQKWWLDCLANAQGIDWKVSVLMEGDNCIAAWPYFTQKKYGTTISLIPILSGYTGILSQRKLNTKEIAELSQAIKKLGLFKQNFLPDDTHWVGLYKQGFRLTTHYTYRIENLNDLSQLQSQMQPRMRRAIKNNREYNVEEIEDALLFYDINKKSWSKQSVDIPYSKEYFQALDSAITENGQRKIYMVREGDVNIGALYVVINGNKAYLFAMGSDPKYRNTVAVKKLIWESIKRLSSEVDSIDCMASMVEGISNFYNNFGMKQDPYYVVSYAKNKVFRNAALLLKDARF